MISRRKLRLKVLNKSNCSVGNNIMFLNGAYDMLSFFAESVRQSNIKNSYLYLLLNAKMVGFCIYIFIKILLYISYNFSLKSIII